MKAAKYEPTHGDPAVLFMNIGWAERYDGTEIIEGNHGWLEENGDDSGEMAAFEPDEDGGVQCWIGGGAVNVSRVDVVLVSRKPGENGHRVVGIYFDPSVFEWNDDAALGYGAYTQDFVFFEAEKRPASEWPGRMSVRRWAYRGGESGREHESLYRVYRTLLTKLGREPGDSHWDKHSS